MPNRYSIFDTQIIESKKDSLKSREFLPLNGIDVIAKIPVKGGVALFYKNNNNNIVYGVFKLQVNEEYTGTTVAISEEVTFSTNDIFIKNGYYEPDTTFYIFYNNNNNIYVRTFLNKQGFLGKEILIKENAIIKKIEKIKENYFIIIEDLSKQNIINSITELVNGELKILSLYENDIIKFEGGIDELLRTQIISIPFNDIGEEKWSCDNSVNNEKGFLYLTGQVKLRNDSRSINGLIFKGVETAYMQMNKLVNEYTLHLRIETHISPINWITILTTNNLKLELKKGDNGKGEKFRFTFPDNTQQELNITELADNANRGLYKNITITTKQINNKLLVSFYFDLNRNIIQELTNIININDLPNYENDSLMILTNITNIDYISLQNYSFPKKVIIDIHNAFDKNIIKLTKTTSIRINENTLNNYISLKQNENINNSTYKVPITAIISINDYKAIFDDSDKTFWLCKDIFLDGNEAENLTIFMEIGSSFKNNKGKRGTIYAKSGTFVDLNNATDFVVYYEKGADVFNQGLSVLIELDDLIFDYSNAPIGGCPEVEDFIKKQVTFFPFFPSELVTTRLDVLCKSSLNFGERFLDNGNGTITDLNEKVMWKKDPFSIQQTKINNQNQAFNNANNFVFDGYTDWRLPTISELQSLSGEVDLFSSCISGFDVSISGAGISGISGAGISGISGVGISGFTFNPCISGDPFIVGQNNILNFTEYILNDGEDFISWSSTSEFGLQGTGEGNYYAYDFFNNTTILEGTSATNTLGILVRDSDFSLKVEYNDDTQYTLPIIKGDRLSIIKEGNFQLKRNEGTFKYNNYTLDFTYEEPLIEKKKLIYTKNYKLNSVNEYELGQYIPIKRNSFNDDMLNTVIPIFLEQNAKISNSIFIEPEKNIRICQNLSQKYSLSPFKIDYDNNTSGITLWVNMEGLYDKIGTQYSLKHENLLTPTYSDYKTLSTQLYSQDTYFCAYHFDKLLDLRRLLINDISITVSGEIVLGGKTTKNTYLREINSINFFDNPKKYKTSEIEVEIDVKNINDRDSYINNFKSIRNFISLILKQWKPATINVKAIVERNTLIMAELLKDEFTQALIGITPRQNTNAYYIRSVDTGEISILSSSANFNDQIDWIGVGRINTPFIKSGVSRIKKSVKNIKVPFETRFNNTKYRVFVFSPNDSKYYVTQKDKDGFIVESSFLIEDEIAWIALNTNQIINGTINWTKGVPEGDLIKNHLDRIININENSSKYVLNFTNLGYPQFINTDYSVILSSNQNINLWIEDKEPSNVSIRRSYTGSNTMIDFLVIESSTKWWKNITS